MASIKPVEEASQDFTADLAALRYGGRQKRASANGIPSSDRTQVKGPTACAYAGAKPSAVAELPNT